MTTATHSARRPAPMQTGSYQSSLLLWVCALPFLLNGAIIASVAVDSALTIRTTILSVYLAFTLLAGVFGVSAGVLFSIPSLTGNFSEGTEGEPRIITNGSLTKITEWITTLVTGVTLVSLYPLARSIWELTGEIEGIGSNTSERVVLVATSTASFFSAFLGTYIKSRTVLPALLYHKEHVEVEMLRLSLRDDIESSREKVEELIDKRIASQLLLLKGMFWMSMDGKTQAALNRAIHYFQELLDREPSNVDALREKARAHKLIAAQEKNNVHELEIAIRLLTTAIEAHPQTESLYYNRACYRALANEQINDWIKDLRKAIQLNPKCASFARNDPDFAAVKDDDLFISETSEIARTQRPDA